MEIYNSILELSEKIPATPDEVLLIFANAVLLYKFFSAIILGVGIWVACKFMNWISAAIRKKFKP